MHAGSHQDFMLLEPPITYKVPAHLASREEQWPQVVGWPVGIRTAIDALFNSMGFGLPALEKEAGSGTDGNWVVKGADPRGKALLIVSSHQPQPPSCISVLHNTLTKFKA
jgi:hypothetical protein